MKRENMQFPLVGLKKIVPYLALASTVVVSSIVGTGPAFAANDRSMTIPETTAETQSTEPLLLAQINETLLAYEVLDGDYAVRVFRENGVVRMNVWDATEGLLRLNGAPATFTVLNDVGGYVSTGEFGGRQVRYFAQAIPNNDPVGGFARLAIFEGNDNIVLIEDATFVSVFNVPNDVTDVVGQNTIFNFETSSYAVRVFRRNDGNRYMNVYNRFTGVQEVNGKPASLVACDPPFDNSITYVASGDRFNQPVEYYARLLDQRGAALEINNVNGQQLFREPSIGTVSTNFPPGDTICLNGDTDPDVRVNDAYVAAVFGDENDLAEIRRLYPEADFDDSARQGRFINAGSFASEEAATIRVLELRARGYDARLVFRDVRFR